jgi:bacillithiol biosynthesis cysteine-adding enzyme BshC
VCGFFSGSFRDVDSYMEKASEIDLRFHRDARTRALSMIESCTPPARTLLDRFVEEGGYFVTTGQQPGLFSGPLYSLYKALTAAGLARELSSVLDRPVVALFWIASEDHDWDEADHTHLLDTANQIRTFRLPPQPGKENSPLHRIPLTEGLSETVASFLEALPETEFSAPFFQALEEGYSDGTTLPRGFLRVMSEFLKDLPVAFVDSAHPELKNASLPVLLREMENAEAHEQLLSRVASHLELEGYSVQVPILERGINLFFEGEQGRDRLYREDGGIRLHRAGTRMTLDEIRTRVQDEPSLLSPNVLLRPIVESTVFPTLAYVGGPGEIAYWGQLRELFETFGLRMPVVHPRRSVTLVEGKIGKVLDKFHRTPDSLARPHHELAGEIALEEVPPDVRQALGEVRGAVGKGSAVLAKAVQSIDSTLKGPVAHARNVSFGAFDEVEKKILQALKRENEIALEQLGKAQRHLFPQGKPQERIVNPFYYLTRYGPQLVSRLLDDFHVALRVQSS